jgi:hypothetical protein
MMMTDRKKKTVWETLSVVDVSDHTEEKNGFTYLSWAWAWTVLKGYYPDATYTKHVFERHGLPFMYDPEDGSAYVMVTVSIPSENEAATEVYPVLNYANKAIKNPNSFEVNTALQRCLAKTISILGLGAYIYAGEDLPPSNKDEPVAVHAGPQSDGKDTEAKGAKMIHEALVTFMSDCETVPDLEVFYRSNSKPIGILKDLDKGLHSDVIRRFKAQKDSIIENESAS